MELQYDNKNRLQEYYHKLYLDIPSYNTVRCGGKDNAVVAFNSDIT